MKTLLWFSLIAVAVYFILGQTGNLVAAWNAGSHDGAAITDVSNDIAVAPATSAVMPQMPSMAMPSLPSFNADAKSSKSNDSDWNGTVTVGTGFAWDNIAIMREADANTQKVWTQAMAQAWDAQALAYASAYTAATPALSRAMKAQIIGEMRTEWARQSYNQTVYRERAAAYPKDYANQLHNQWARDTGWTVAQYIFLAAAVTFLAIFWYRELVKIKKGLVVVRAGGNTLFDNNGQINAVADNKTAWDQFRAIMNEGFRQKKADKKEEPAIREEVKKGA